MEPSFRLDVIEEQIRECYARVVWTHKTHEKCSDILNARLNTIKVWQIILSAITTTGILVAVFGESKEIGILSAVLSFVLTILNTYVKQYDLGGIAQKHSDSAIAIWNIRECYLSLLTDIRTGQLDVDQVRKKRDQLQGDLFKVYKGSPRTITKAYNQASNALKNMEELTFSDNEIDSFLPSALHKNKGNDS